jgi:hypothetical protein
MTAPRATARGQPGVGIAGIALVVPVALILSVGLGSPERSLVVFAPLSTFAFPVVVMIAFWWDDWPGTILRAPLLGISDTLLVLVGAVGMLTIEVRDDGVGGADPKGDGLVGIADRVDALEGRLRITSRPGATVVLAELRLPTGEVPGDRGGSKRGAVGTE